MTPETITRADRWRGDALAFTKECLGFEPTAEQASLLSELSDRGRFEGRGDTWAMAAFVIWSLVKQQDVRICLVQARPTFLAALQGLIETTPLLASMLARDASGWAVRGSEASWWIKACSPAVAARMTVKHKIVLAVR